MCGNLLSVIDYITHWMISTVITVKINTLIGRMQKSMCETLGFDIVITGSVFKITQCFQVKCHIPGGCPHNKLLTKLYWSSTNWQKSQYISSGPLLKLQNALHPPTDHNFYYCYCICRAVNFIQHNKLSSAKVISSITEVRVLNLVKHNNKLQIF